MHTALLNATVTAVRRETDRIVTLELRPADSGSSFPAFTAGAHIDLHLGNGMVRSYSVCNAQDEVDR